MNLGLPKNHITALAPLLLTTGLLLFGFMILVIGIESMHMRPDEELTFRNMSLSFPDSMIRLATRNNQAPLWWIQIWGWQRTAGTTEFAGRINSILWSMLTLSVIYQIGQSWFGERRFGWFAIAVLSVNSYFFIYALEIRMYALGMLVVTLSMQAFHRWLQNQTWQSAILYGISATALLYTHYYFAFVILAQVAYFVLYLLGEAASSPYKIWKLIKQGMLLAITALIIWLPGLILLVGQLQFIDFASSGGLNIPTKATNTQTLLELVQLSSNGYWLVYAGIVLIGVSVLWRKKAFWLALVWLIVSPALVLIVNLEATIYNVRYTSFFIPSIGLTIGIVLAALPFPKIGTWVNWLLLVILCGVSLYNLPNYIPDRIPYRHIYADVGMHYEDGDALFALPTYPDPYLDDQYHRYLPPNLIDNRVFSLDEARDHRRVWFITPLFLNEEAQSEFRALEDSHRVWYVADRSACTLGGYCYVAQLMIAPPNDEAVYFSETLGFLGADIEPITDNQLSVLLWWEVENRPEADYSISLQLLAEDGFLVTQIDRQIMPPNSDEVPTSTMQSDGNYIDERILEIPPDLANGDYQLQVLVYQWWDGVRLTVPDGSDAIVIDTITMNR